MSNIFKFIGLDRFGNLLMMIKENGGLKKSFLKLFRYDSVKRGQLVGTDKYGNRYYQNPYYFYGRNRWVEYADHIGFNYDASQIPAEWYGWMHYKTDLPPMCDKSRPQYKWMSDHSENLSATKDRYMPYTTTRPKIHAWNPKVKPENTPESSGKSDPEKAQLICAARFYGKLK